MVCKWAKRWKVRVLLRVIAFGWLALQKKILTLDNLRRRRLIVVNVCPMCLNDEKTVDHLLLHCKFASQLRSSVLGRFGCLWVLPFSLLQFFEEWCTPIKKPRWVEMWKVSFLGVLWVVQKEKNRRCFEGKSRCPGELAESLKFMVASWLLYSLSF